MNKTYSELMTIPTFKERYEYLKLSGQVGIQTFGCNRYLNQMFYSSKEWRQVRNFVIVRDCGCDLGISDREILGMINVHHMNPITIDDVINRPEYCLDPEYLICSADLTHKAIHYSDDSLLIIEPVIRKPNDTIPWR